MTTRDEELGSEIKSLLAGLSDRGAQHLTEVETDLMQTTFLLGEAIEKLGASFMSIHETLCQHQAMVDSLVSRLPDSEEAVDKLKAMQGEIGRHVNSAVTGLQFQDMTSQLIARTVRRINGLRDVLATIGANCAVMTPADANAKMAEQLHQINKLLEDQNSKLESTLWKSVSQTHMESGDVELF